MDRERDGQKKMVDGWKNGARGHWADGMVIGWKDVWRNGWQRGSMKELPVKRME